MFSVVKGATAYCRQGKPNGTCESLGRGRFTCSRIDLLTCRACIRLHDNSAFQFDDRVFPFAAFANVGYRFACRFAMQ
jgi:hypothetical protein